MTAPKKLSDKEIAGLERRTQNSIAYGGATSVVVDLLCHIAAITAERDTAIHERDGLRDELTAVMTARDFTTNESARLRAALEKCAVDLEKVTSRAADQVLRIAALTERAERAEATARGGRA